MVLGPGIVAAMPKALCLGLAAGLIAAVVAIAGHGSDAHRRSFASGSMTTQSPTSTSTRSDPAAPPARPLEWIEPGTIVGDGPSPGWSDLILFARPRLASGDLDAVPDLVARFAGLSSLTILADVVPGHMGRYELDRVGIGLALESDGREAIAIGADIAGADLGFLGRRVFLENERVARASVHQAARTRTLLVFDADAILLRDGDHVARVVRHAILADPRTGRVSTFVWLLDPRPDGTFALADDDPPKVLPPGLHEDRQIDVDADRFTLGIPTPDAFALVRTPPGTPFAFPAGLRPLAEARTFSDEAAPELEIGLRNL